MLNSAQRQAEIHSRLMSQGRASVGDLVSKMKVTPMTIRRDLLAMEQAGLLMRTHGGCVLHSPFVGELSFSEKEHHRRAQKAAIAREMIKFLKSGDSVYFDTGTTVLQVVRAIPPGLSLRIFTNNLRVAIELFGRKNMEVIVYGGMLGRKSPDLLNEIALTQVRQYRIDVAVLGADAIDPASGEFYGADMGASMLSKTAQKQAERFFVVADSSKFGKRSLTVTGTLKKGSTLITDREVATKDREKLRATGAKLIFATPQIK